MIQENESLLWIYAWKLVSTGFTRTRYYIILFCIVNTCSGYCICLSLFYLLKHNFKRYIVFQMYCFPPRRFSKYATDIRHCVDKIGILRYLKYTPLLFGYVNVSKKEGGINWVVSSNVLFLFCLEPLKL